ncbi:MAG: hypothetical protein Q7R67_01785, partial [bacterium]|nr:hypothetical protein [bacterium]
LIFLSSVFILICIPVFFLFYRTPTCFDGKLNGDETGLDCGGSCQMLCRAESLPIILKGDPRVLTVATSTYEVVALLENPNNTADIYKAGYTLKLYDVTSAIPVKVIEGETYVPKGATFAIFEGPFNLEAGIVPARATLEWDTASLIWQKTNYEYPEVVVKDIVLARQDSSPRLEATVENLSLENVANVDLVALISDAQGNIFAASKTFLDSLPARGESSVVFTWPRPFAAQAIDIDIIVRVLPDRTFIR